MQDLLCQIGCDRTERSSCNVQEDRSPRVTRPMPAAAPTGPVVERTDQRQFGDPDMLMRSGCGLPPRFNSTATLETLADYFRKAVVGAMPRWNDNVRSAWSVCARRLVCAAEARAALLSTCSASRRGAADFWPHERGVRRFNVSCDQRRAQLSSTRGGSRARCGPDDRSRQGGQPYGSAIYSHMEPHVKSRYDTNHCSARG